MAKAAKKHHKITEQGRAAMRLAGKRTAAGSFNAMKAGQQAKLGIRHEVAEFRRGLEAKVNVAEHPGARALIRSAAASFAAICQLSHRLSVANAKNTERFAELLPTIQSELRRTLALLGVTTKDAEDERSAEDQAALDSLLDYRKKDGTDGEAESDRNTAIPE
jgi:hypothetical protein